MSSFTIKREKFAKSLQTVNRAISIKATLPILQNIMLKLEKGNLQLLATDLDKSIEANIGVDTEGEDFAITLPAKLLFNYINGIKSENITCTLIDDNLEVKSDKAKSLFTGTDAEEYPKLFYKKEGKGLKINKEELKNVVDETFFAAASNDQTPVFEGILIEPSEKNNEVKFVSTDGFRLSQRITKIPEEFKDIIGDYKVIIPSKILAEFTRIMPNDEEEIEIHIQKDNNLIIFSIAEFIFTSKVIEGEFPNYKAIIPEEKTLQTIDLDTETLLSNVRVATIFSEESNTPVRINIRIKEKQIQVVSSNPQIGENIVTQEILELSKEAKNIDIGFNANYIINLLSNVKCDKITLKYQEDNTKPIVIRIDDREDFLHLITPLNPYWGD